MTLATALAVVSLVVSLALLAGTIWLWVAATRRQWLESVTFVSHLSLAALVFAAFSSVVSALAVLFASTK